MHNPKGGCSQQQNGQPMRLPGESQHLEARDTLDNADYTLNGSLAALRSTGKQHHDSTTASLEDTATCHQGSVQESPHDNVSASPAPGYDTQCPWHLPHRAHSGAQSKQASPHHSVLSAHARHAGGREFKGAQACAIGGWAAPPAGR
eukprot:TRINITY_DN20884_c0_g1_i1.p2 TRINITY_DN20884_c0_g1~~TRINITY_DN20884_c0_g1_i1.p2  ORF type:complete len:147 (+),score=8.27 TRINITY_DN20884_c0_g1_i1:202-642(+)